MYLCILIVPDETNVDMEKVIDENKQGTSLELALKPENSKKLFIESYGCQMNFSDSEIVASILQKEGFNTTSQLEDASQNSTYSTLACSKSRR